MMMPYSADAMIALRIFDTRYADIADDAMPIWSAIDMHMRFRDS